MALASCLHVWLCACIFKCLCRGKSSKWNELSREEGAHMAVVISALSVFSHQALCIWVKKRRRRRRLIWKPIRRVRPFSNYTEIILIASESCRALNFISLLLFAYECLSHKPTPDAPSFPSFFLTRFTLLSIKFSLKISFYAHATVSLHLGLLSKECEGLFLSVLGVCTCVCL